MNSLNDIVLRIHMTYINNKHDVEWIISFEEEISPLSQEDFNKLIGMLEGVFEQEQANFMETIMHNDIPMHLQAKAATTSNLVEIIERLKVHYPEWKAKA